MTYVSMGGFPKGSLVVERAGDAFDRINHFFGLLGQVGGAASLDYNEDAASAQRTPIEECLREIQETISNVSMHLPEGFAGGLNRQFANLLDDDAWEEEDELITPTALRSFILLLIVTSTKRRPGIGTNGEGSITASWSNGENRLVVECLSCGKISAILARRMGNDEMERAAFGPMQTERLPHIIAPFSPEVWFDG